MKSFITKISLLLLFNIILCETAGNTTTLSIKTKNNIDYFSAQDLIKQKNLKSTYYQAKEKLEIYIENTRLYFSPLSSFIRVNDKVYHLTHSTTMIGGELYIPLLSFKKIAEMTNIPIKINVKENKKIQFTTNVYDVENFIIDKKNNGLEIVFKTNKQFKQDEIATSVTNGGWLNITLLNTKLDSNNFNSSPLVYPVVKAKFIQQKKSVSELKMGKGINAFNH